MALAASLRHLTTGDALPPLKPGVFRLYSMKFCPYAERTRLVLAAKGIEYEVVNINTFKKPEWFVNKNPLQLVPVLERDDKIVYESLVTVYYLEQLYPEQTPLAPRDPYLEAKDKMFIEFLSSKVIGLGSRAATKDPEVVKNFTAMLKHVEEELKSRGGNYFFGSRPGIVDYVTIPFCLRVRPFGIFGEGKDVPDELSTLAGWIQRMREDAAVKTTIHPDSAYVTFMRNHRTENSMFDEIETPN